jgi:AraC-like DNA-binding protein
MFFLKPKALPLSITLWFTELKESKELLSYDELTITEIAYKMNYSGISHLSNQFKKVTGITPSFYKALKSSSRISLEDL